MTNFTYQSVSPLSADVSALVDKLNQYQIELYGIDLCNLESLESLATCGAFMIGAYDNNRLIGIAALKVYEDYGEIKRFYVEEQYRGTEVASTILNILEIYAQDRGITKLCLETGNLHNAALKFYRKKGYRQIESFGSYQPNEVSVYMEKYIT